jgi:hypothetical protein
MKSLGDLDFQDGGGNDEANGAEIAATLETVMGQLMAKDILYEPLKDLRDNVRLSTSLLQKKRNTSFSHLSFPQLVP